MATPMPMPKARFFDSNGDPLAGGKLYSYAAGTSTPQTTYANSVETVPNANPVILDANGEATIFMGSSAYKFVLKDSTDTTLWTVDGVAQVVDGTVTTAKLADGSVTTAKIADLAVTTAKIADGAVGTDKIAAATITTSKLFDGIVTTAKMADLAITTAKIADSAVGTDKIAAGTITTSKLFDGIVTVDKMASNSVSTIKIVDNAVTPAKLSAIRAVASSASSGNFNYTLTTYVSVTNMEINLTGLSGVRPVMLMVLGSTSESYVGVSGSGEAYLRFYHGTDGTISEVRIGTTGGRELTPLLMAIHNPSAGTSTYALQVKAVTSGTVYVNNCYLYCYEM